MQSPFQIKISGNLGRSVGRSNGGLENLAFPFPYIFFLFVVYREGKKK